MKAKQIVGILVAGFMFIVICVASMLADKFLGSSSKNIFGKSLSEKSSTPLNEYVGVLKVEGDMEIAEQSTSIFETVGYSHYDILDKLNEYKEDKNNKGILLYINSPGGTVSSADDLYLHLMKYKKETKRPIYVYMAEEACSGGYYIATAGDKLYANRNAWTGSIGVYMELANYKELFDKLGIKTTYIKTGANKTMGSATQDLTAEQQKILQSLVDESYEQFIEVITAGRKNMTEEEIRKAADGRLYSATQAKNIGLIDDVKTYEEVKETISNDLGANVEIYEEKNDGISSIFGDLYSSIKSLADTKDKSETEQLLEYVENDGSGVPMYAMPKR